MIKTMTWKGPWCVCVCVCVCVFLLNLCLYRDVELDKSSDYVQLRSVEFICSEAVLTSFPLSKLHAGANYTFLSAPWE